MTNVPMTILVTGSSGFVGRRLMDWLPRPPEHFIGVDRVRGQTTNVVVDLAAPFALRETPDVIVHAAADVSVTRSVAEPAETIRNNAMSTLEVLEFARRNDVGRVLCFSTAAVYGDAQSTPTPETASFDPLSPYATSKIVAERLARDFSRQYELDVVIVRPFNIYDDDLADAGAYSGVMRIFNERIKAREALTIFGDGTQTRDFIHARDISSFLRHWLDGKVPDGEYNLGTGLPTSILQLATWFVESTTPPCPITFAPGRPGEIQHSQADISRALATGWQPKVSVREGVSRLAGGPMRGSER